MRLIRFYILFLVSCFNFAADATIYILYIPSAPGLGDRKKKKTDALMRNGKKPQIHLRTTRALKTLTAVV